MTATERTEGTASVPDAPGPDAEDRLRVICLALPEASEQETWGEPTFRVRGKIFAMTRRGEGRHEVWCKARPGIQEILTGDDSARFFVPPYVGHRGWIGVRLDRFNVRGERDVGPDWDELQELVRESYRMTAPKRLAAGMDEVEDGVG